MQNIDAFILESRLRQITEGKLLEYHIMQYYKYKYITK